MRLFVAGVRGVIGRQVVPRLIAAGHEVTGIARTPQKAEGVQAMGGQALMADAQVGPPRGDYRGARGSARTSPDRPGTGVLEMELAGLEPATSWVRSRRSPKLSYSPRDGQV